MMQPLRAVRRPEAHRPDEPPRRVREVHEEQDETGQPVEVWETIRTWRANRKDTPVGSGSARIKNCAGTHDRVHRSLVCWPTTKHRLVHDDMVWDIEGLAELGRRVALEVTATAVREYRKWRFLTAAPHFWPCSKLSARPNMSWNFI